MSITDEIKKSRNAPRHISPEAWYYVNDGSVDLVVHAENRILRLRRPVLKAMLSELKPARKSLKRKR